MLMQDVLVGADHNRVALKPSRTRMEDTGVARSANDGPAAAKSIAEHKA